MALRFFFIYILLGNLSEVRVGLATNKWGEEEGVDKRRVLERILGTGQYSNSCCDRAVEDLWSVFVRICIAIYYPGPLPPDKTWQIFIY